MKYGERYEGGKFKTVFVGKRRAPADVLEEVTRAGSVLDGLGLTPENAGNISVRSHDGMFITVGGVNKGRLNADDLAQVIAFDGETARTMGTKEPSSETPMHWAVYRAFEGARAIIHVHEDKAVDSPSELEGEFGIRCTREFFHYGTPEQAMAVVEVLRGFRYAIIAGHGIICYGADMDDALGLVLRVHDFLD